MSDDERGRRRGCAPRLGSPPGGAPAAPAGRSAALLRSGARRSLQLPRVRPRPRFARGTSDASVSSGMTTRVSSVWTTRASRARSPRACRRAPRVLERDVRQHDHARLEHVRRIEPAAEPCLDHGDVDLLGTGTRQPRPSAPRTASPRRERAHARERRSRSASVDHRIRSDQPRTCGEMYAPTRSPAACRSAADHPRRRRLAVRADDVDRREPRCGSPSSASSRASAEADLLGPRRQASRATRRCVASAVLSPSARARAGSARASRARPRRPRAARWRRSARSRACPRRARSPCAAARARPRRRRSPARARA